MLGPRGSVFPKGSPLRAGINLAGNVFATTPDCYAKLGVELRDNRSALIQLITRAALACIFPFLILQKLVKQISQHRRVALRVFFCSDFMLNVMREIGEQCV